MLKLGLFGSGASLLLTFGCVWVDVKTCLFLVVRREVEEFLMGQFIFKKTITYIPEQKHKANRMKVVARGLTQAEAVAMVKLLKATS